MGMSFLTGFTIEMTAILTPGVIGRRRVRGLDLVVECFGIDDFSLAGWFMVDGVG